MSKKKQPRAKKVLDPHHLIVARGVLLQAPWYDGRNSFLDWIDGKLKDAGYVRVGDVFVKQSDVDALPTLKP